MSEQGSPDLEAMQASVQAFVEQAVARGIVAAAELMGPTIRSHAEHGEAAPEGSAGAETRRVLAKNIPIALGRYVLDRMATPVIGAVGLAGAGWRFGLAESLLIIAQAQGPGYASWLAFVLETMRQNAARLALAPDAARRLGEALLKPKA